MSSVNDSKARKEDIERLKAMDPDTLIDLFLLHIRTVFRVDGLYFLGIEKRFGTEAAIEVDKETWQMMGVLEAKGLKKLPLTPGSRIRRFIDALLRTSWSLDQPFKEVEVDEENGRAVYTVRKCMTQHTRLRKGLGEFPCKPVRDGYLRGFAAEFDPKIELTTAQPPPDSHPDTLWCRWVFTATEE